MKVFWVYGVEEYEPPSFRMSFETEDEAKEYIQLQESTAYKVRNWSKEDWKTSKESYPNGSYYSYYEIVDVTDRL
jgi:hypothetical protein